MVNFNCSAHIIGVNSQTVRIITDPAGIPVDGQPDTYDYPILTSVTLMCMVTTVNGSTPNVTSYLWNAVDCYDSNNVVCFYGDGIYMRTRQSITGYELSAQDAGTATCTATIDGVMYTSDPLTLRISGELFI